MSLAAGDDDDGDDSDDDGDDVEKTFFWPLVMMATMTQTITMVMMTLRMMVVKTFSGR